MSPLSCMAACLGQGCWIFQGMFTIISVYLISGKIFLCCSQNSKCHRLDDVEKKNVSIRSVYNLITSQSEPFCVVEIPSFLLFEIIVVFLIVDKECLRCSWISYVNFSVTLIPAEISATFIWH